MKPGNTRRFRLTPMKQMETTYEKPITIAAATLALALGACGQGSVDIDNSSASALYGVAIDAPGNYYVGTFGAELWELNGTTIPAGINIPTTPGYAVAAYGTMVGSGFALERTWSVQNMPFAGIVQLGQVEMANVNPPGSTVVLALAVWNNSAPSWSAMLSSATSATRSGIIAFVNTTWNYEVPNGVPPPTS